MKNELILNFFELKTIIKGQLIVFCYKILFKFILNNLFSFKNHKAQLINRNLVATNKFLWFNFERIQKEEEEKITKNRNIWAILKFIYLTHKNIKFFNYKELG